MTGNIGKVQPLDFLDDLKAGDLVVYELSSFQLLDLKKSPHIAVVLMSTSEHLDYHKNNREYLNAKTAISKFQQSDDFTIVNSDYPGSREIGSQGLGKKLYFSLKDASVDCFAKEDKLWLKSEGEPQAVMNVQDLQLKGAHNWENFCAAILAAHVSGAPLEAISQACRDFKGLEHRLEFVAEKQNIKFYNDSFSTTPETAIAAIKAFSEPLIIILGGSTKYSDFTQLAETILKSRNIKTLILIGEEAQKIRQAVEKRGKINSTILAAAKNMSEIFLQIRQVAVPGDVVLLSPACASFGMFKNYKDRGEQFKKFALAF